MLFGSNSDERKVLPGIERWTEENPDVRVEYASADNTPEKVARLADELLSHEGELRWVKRRAVPVISGAGMSNVLTGVMKVSARYDDLNIGIPITDSMTGGLSSVLSTDEKPPRNPVLAVSLNGTYAAANIAHRFNECGYGDVVVADTSIGAVDLVVKKLEIYGLPFEVRDVADLDPDALVITPFALNATHWLREIDEKLREGKGIQIAVKNSNPLIVYESDEHKGPQYDDTIRMNEFAQYLAQFRHPMEATGFVSMGGYVNAAIVAAQIMRDSDALMRIKGEKDDKHDTLNDHPGYVVSGGEVMRGDE